MIFTLLGINPSKCQYYFDHLPGLNPGLTEHYLQSFLLIDKKQQYLHGRIFTMNLNNHSTIEMLTDRFLSKKP